LDLISYNSRVYNGIDNPLTKHAKKMVETIRCEIKRNINYADDVKKKKYEEAKKPVGKMTAPINRYNMDFSTMDQF